MTTTGGALHWLAEHLLGEPPEKVGARLAVLEETARSVAPGSDGLVGIPSLIGERAPLWDPRMRGAFFGLGLQHRPAHLYRALVEGAAFLLAIHLEALHSAGAAVDRLILAGGGSRSALACGIRSEVLGRPISVCATPQTTALGAALLASIASGCHPDAETASAAMCRTGEVLVVPAERQEQYQRCLRRFRDVYAALAGIAK